MAGEISNVAGVYAEPLPARMSAPPARQGKQMAAQPSAGGQAGVPPDSIKEPGAGYPEDRGMLGAMMERARTVGMGKTTTVAFERDGTDGQMYLQVKDKHTGKDLYRIPKRYLEAKEPDRVHRLDVKI